MTQLSIHLKKRDGGSLMSTVLAAYRSLGAVTCANVGRGTDIRCYGNLVEIFRLYMYHEGKLETYVCLMTIKIYEQQHKG